MINEAFLHQPFLFFSLFRHGMSFDNLRRFIIYCTYAFGIPLILAFITFLINHNKWIPDKFNNQIGNGTCSIGIEEYGKIAPFIYVYCPIIISISINIVFYSITAYKIYRVQQETSFNDGESKRHAKNEVEKERFFLYVRLFVIMGISWIAEVISWYFEASVIFYVVSILNCMQGFIIFMIFVWKSKVYKMMVRK